MEQLLLEVVLGGEKDNSLKRAEMFGLNLLDEQEKKAALQRNNPQDSWKLELKEAIKTYSDLEKVLDQKLPKTSYPIFIPKNFAKKILRAGDKSPLWKQFVPHPEENKKAGMNDPIGDKNHSKPGKIIHRYKNRLLFFPTPVCPITCRYCFRKNELANPSELFDGQLKEAINYLNNHPEVNEVILSGGDPLILSDEKLEVLFENFSKVPSIKYLRIHSRTPVILPSRVTESLCDLLSRYKKKFFSLIIAVHTNHSDELDDEVKASLINLKKTGVKLLSQTVLLKEVNDDLRSLKTLFTDLSDLGVTPYYLHHPDRVKGGMHFYLSLTEGRYLYHLLRNELPGWMIPQYVIDIPEGEGKSPAYNPEAFDFHGSLINKDGQTISIDPLH